VADIFQEVDEEIRREQLKKLWDRYGLLVVVLAILIVAGVGAWRFYQYWENQKAAAAGAQFEQAVALADAGKTKEAEAAFGKIATESAAGYRVLARLRAAAGLSQQDAKGAAAAFDKIADDNTVDRSLRDVAALRAGLLMVDSVSLADMQKRLDPMAAAGQPFRHTARELLALSAWRNHDAAATKRYLDMITDDPETPPSTRSRADVLAALLAANGKS
jgi:hypothetical protein